MSIHPPIDPELDLKLERIVDVRPELVWRAWTEPKHLMRWFTPAPWETVDCKIDLRPGGIFSTTMRSSEGVVQPEGIGCYLEIEAERKLMWTDALGAEYRPQPKPFMTATILLVPEGTGTRYIAIARHVDTAGKKQHEEMGFHFGWNTALDQLVAYVKGW